MFTVRMLVLVALLAPAGLAAAHPDKRVLAEELIAVMHPEKTIDQVMQQVSGAMKQQLQAMKVPPDMQASSEQMNQELMSYIRAKLDWAKLKPQYVSMYADVFTEDELRQALAFYRSPGGQAFLNKTPQLAQRSLAMVQGLITDLPAHMDEMRAKLQKQIEEKQKQEKPKIQGLD